VPGRPLVLAHRGARMVAPENTLEAFVTALGQGADGVELDVHRTDDGGLVVHHDAEAIDLGLLADRTVAEVRAARPEIPTLEEVLDACAGALVNIEIKNLPTDPGYDAENRGAQLVVELLGARGGRDAVLVSSFNLATIDRVLELDASIATGFLSIQDPREGLAVCAAHGHRALHPFFVWLTEEAAPALLAEAAALEVAINVWTVNGEDDIARMAAAGVESIITDVPDVGRRVVDAV
jgi:glycerophosphoryl diester phosphodiesterase